MLERRCDLLHEVPVRGARNSAKRLAGMPWSIRGPSLPCKVDSRGWERCTVMWFEALRCIGSVPMRWSAMIKNKQRRIRHRKRPPRSVQPSSGKCGKKHTKNIHPCFRFRHKHGKAGVVRAVPCLAATRPDPPLLSRTRPASSPAGRLFDGINDEWNHETTAKKKKSHPAARPSLTEWPAGRRAGGVA